MLVEISTFIFNNVRYQDYEYPSTTAVYNTYISDECSLIINTDVISTISPDENMIYDNRKNAIENRGKHRFKYYTIYLTSNNGENTYYITTDEYERLKKVCNIIKTNEQNVL